MQGYDRIKRNTEIIHELQLTRGASVATAALTVSLGKLGVAVV